MQFLAGLRPNKSNISRRDISSTAEASHEGSGSRIPFVKGAATKAAQPKFPGIRRNAKLFAAELVFGEPQNLSRSHWQHSFAAEFVSREPLAAELHSQQNLSRNLAQSHLSRNGRTRLRTTRNRATPTKAAAAEFPLPRVPHPQPKPPTKANGTCLGNHSQQNLSRSHWQHSFAA